MKTKNNKSRTLINVVGLPSILFIVYQGGMLFYLFIGLVMFLATKEFSELMKIKNYSINTIFLYLLIPIVCWTNLSLLYIYSSELVNMLFPFILGIIQFAIIIILVIFILEIFRAKKNPIENIAITFFGFIWIILFLSNIIFIRNHHGGLQFTLCMFFSVWACDSAAFYFGSKFGKKKILPSISPNKTWLGTIAGYISSVLVVYLLVHFNFFNDINFNLIDILILGTIFGGIGQLGDFFESKIKRDLDVKDSGTLLRGHGGVLDRFDSLFFVIPILFLYLYYRFPLL